MCVREREGERDCACLCETERVCVYVCTSMHVYVHAPLIF